MQLRLELLICVDRIMPEHLSLEPLRIKGESGERYVVRSEFSSAFDEAVDRLRHADETGKELAAVLRCIAAAR